VPATTSDLLYKGLSFSKAEIRLLSFDSSATGLSLQCSLITVPLPKAPPYIALSYTWGNSTNTIVILVNKNEVKITANLCTALLRLRAEGITYIWADALCINQGDDEERTAQVGRMGTIFRKASEVAVVSNEFLYPIFSAPYLAGRENETCSRPPSNSCCLEGAQY
jgi:Heterokaryon incompatibility protein (HET)